MTLQEKSELVRLLNLYQADLLNLNRKNIRNGKTEYFCPRRESTVRTRSNYQHKTLCRTRQGSQVMVGGMTMFIWLTSPTIGQVLVNLNLVTAVTCVQGRNTVCFTGGEEDYIVVTESLEDIYERIQSAEKRYRK